MAKTSLLIYGQSGQGLVCADLARLAGYESIKFIDDDKAKQDAGALDLAALGPDELGGDFFIAIGDNEIRQKIFARVAGALRGEGRIINLIHPCVAISPSALISSQGVAIMPGAIINAKARIGRGVIINSGSIIEHECELGDFSHISVGARLAGGVRVGEGVFVGAGATVLPGVKISSGVILGAGAVATKDLAGPGIYLGVPAKGQK